MHNYSHDSKLSPIINYGSVVIAIVLSYLLYLVLDVLSLPNWIIVLVDLPAGFGLYSSINWLFNEYGWSRIKSDIPNINGVWVGYLKTSYDDFKNRQRIKLTITQTWSQISILAETKRSNSHSTSASMVLNSEDGETLAYNYHNIPKQSAELTLHEHDGTCRLSIMDSKTLKGTYYSGRDRRNYGEFTVEFINKNA